MTDRNINIIEIQIKKACGCVAVQQLEAEARSGDQWLFNAMIKVICSPQTSQTLTSLSPIGKDHPAQVRVAFLKKSDSLDLGLNSESLAA